MDMTRHSIWRKAATFAALCAAVTFAACSSDDEPIVAAPQGQEGEVAEVPLTITFSTAWEVGDPDTKTPPPGQEEPVDVDGWDETDADKVRIVTFRRKDMDDQLQGQVNDAPFIYDPTNDYTVDCVKPEVKPENGYFTAKASLRKIYGYEYRVVALAYDSKRDLNARTGGGVNVVGEQGLFTISLEDGTTFDNFEARVTPWDVWDFLDHQDKGTLDTNYDLDNDCLNGQVLFVPEFFYGYCTTESGDEIIKFAERGSDGSYDKQIPLTGILYRGVAKVTMELELSSFSHLSGTQYIDHAALMATNVNTTVGLTSYDDFLTPSSPLEDWHDGGLLGGDHDLYTVIDYADAYDDGGTRKVMLETYVLPAKMKLAARFLTSGTGPAGVINYYTCRNGSIHVANTSYADGATGVIMPDVDGNEFYFRRNHKYVFRGNSSSILADDNRLD